MEAVMVKVVVSASAVAAVRAEKALGDKFKREEAARSTLEQAADETAAAVVTARDAGVPWARITELLGGIKRQSAVERVRRWEARGKGGRLASFEGTAIDVPDPGPGAGVWGWASVRAAAAEGAKLAGDAERRNLLAENAAPGHIVATVRAVQLAALTAAADAIDAAAARCALTGAEADAIARDTAAGYLPEGRTAAGA